MSAELYGVPPMLRLIADELDAGTAQLRLLRIEQHQTDPDMTVITIAVATSVERQTHQHQTQTGVL